MSALPAVTGSGESVFDSATSALKTGAQQLSVYVTTVRLHPPLSVPLSGVASSRVYSGQVPLGFDPLKTDRAAP